jgi:hypothetical protein
MSFRKFLSGGPPPPPVDQPAPEQPPADAPAIRETLAAIDNALQSTAQGTAETNGSALTPALFSPNTQIEGEETSTERAFELNVPQIELIKRQLMTDALMSPTASERTAASKTLLAYSIRTKDKRDRTGELGNRAVILNVMAHVENAQKLSRAHE